MSSMLMKRAFVILAVAFGCLGGCGLNLNNDDSDGGSGGAGGAPDGGASGAGGGGGISAATATARADCAAFISDTLCPSLVVCDTSGTLDTPSCLAEIRAQLDCSKVGSETSGLPACKSDIGSSACTDIFPPGGNFNLPRSCAGVFLP
jgi:hypothetical protein